MIEYQFSKMYRKLHAIKDNRAASSDLGTFAFLSLLPYFWETIAGFMRFSSYMIRYYKFAGMLPANFYIPG